MKRSLSLVFIFFSIGGCSVTATLVDRSTGIEYRGKSVGNVYASEGRLQSEIDGETFIGSWSYMATGGSSTIGSGSVITSSGTSAVGTISAFDISAAGRGVVNMKGDNGSLIRCVYDWNEWSSSGIGECERNDGRKYDLRLKL